MSAALDAIAMIVVLLVTVWVVGFGLVGGELGLRTGRSRPVGFAIGALAGPFGVGYLWWQGRSEPPSGLEPSEPEGPTGLSL